MAARKKSKRSKKGKKAKKRKPIARKKRKVAKKRKVTRKAKKKTRAKKKTAKRRAKKKVARKSKKKTVKKRAKKKVAKKTKKKTRAKKKVAKKKKARAKRKVAKRKATPRSKAPAVVTTAPIAAPVPDEERIGVVTHYYTHLSVAVVHLDTGALRVGDTIHIKGYTSDFTQRVASMEIDHVHVSEARAGQSFGLKVVEHAREHDGVFRVRTY